MAKIVDLHNSVIMLSIAHTLSKKPTYPQKKIALCDKANLLPVIGKLTKQQTNMNRVILFTFWGTASSLISSNFLQFNWQHTVCQEYKIAKEQKWKETKSGHHHLPFALTAENSVFSLENIQASGISQTQSVLEHIRHTIILFNWTTKYPY